MKKALEPFDSRAFDNQSTAHMRASDSSSSSIRTVTVGPGFSPDQPCSARGRGLCFACLRLSITASEELHLALKQRSRAILPLFHMRLNRGGAPGAALPLKRRFRLIRFSKN